MAQKALIAVLVYITSINTKPLKSRKRENLLKVISSNYKIEWKSYKISCIEQTSSNEGKAISSGERKIILNVFEHFKTENSSSNENAVTTLTFKVPVIVKHRVKSQSRIQPNRKKECNKFDELNLGVVRRTGSVKKNVFHCVFIISQL